MLRRFRTIKPEIRVLAISDGYNRFSHKLASNIIGAVFRGGDTLDGVIRIHKPKGALTTALVRAIRGSNHYAQIRVLIVEKSEFLGRKVDLERLSKLTGRPLILVRRDSGRGWSVDGFGIHPDDARRIVEVCTRDRAPPEPVVVARMIAKDLNRFVQAHPNLNL